MLRLYGTSTPVFFYLTRANTSVMGVYSFWWKSLQSLGGGGGCMVLISVHHAHDLHMYVGLGCPRRTCVRLLTSRWRLPLMLRFDPWLESLGKTLTKIVINQSIKCSPSLAVAAGDSGLLRSRLLTLLPKQRALKWLAASSVTRGY